jgi:peptide/nickel transport system substrate-binding protein
MPFPGKYIPRFQSQIFIFVVIFAACFVCACGPASPVPAGSVTFLIETTPTNLDPRIGTDAQSQRLDGLMFSSLVERDANMNVTGDLAERWEMPDPLTYIFHLRSGVQFHDGRALTSADVKFTFDSMITGAIQSPKRGAFRMVKLVEAPDPLTVIFHLSEPYASFPWSLVRPAVGIVPAGSGADFAQHPIGSGPFQFESARQDDEIILRRNSKYFHGVPNIDRVQFRIVPDAVVRALELRKGSADLEFNSLTPDMVAVLAHTQNLEVAEQPGTILTYLAFNCQDPILSQTKIRQALAYATDRETMVKTLLRGQARVADGLLPPSNWAYEPDMRRYAYAPARAESLLDEAGYPRRGNSVTGTRMKLTIKTSTDQNTRLIATVLQDEWRRVGIDLEILPLEFATLFSDVTRGSFQIYTLRWVGANNDPDIFEYVFSSKKIPPAGANRGRYRNAQLDALVDQGRVESDSAKRKAIFSQVQKLIAEDEPYLPLWFLDSISVHRDRIAHTIFTTAGDYDFLRSIQIR